MLSTRAENLSRALTSATPTLLGVLGVLVLVSPLRLAEGHVPAPILPLVVVYFWSIYSPSHLPAFGVFLIGLSQDLVSGGPLGLWPSVYLFIRFVVLSQRGYFQGREQRVVWLGFAVVATLAAILLWLAMSLMSRAALSPYYLGLQMLVTVAVYPVIAAFFDEFHRRVIVEA